MANRLVVFPAGRRASALAYRDWCNAQWAGRDGGDFAYLRNDAAGRWVVPYLGPPFAWQAKLLPEPDGGAAMRDGGETVDVVAWPGEA